MPHYYLGPWEWRRVGPRFGWAPPPGCTACVDLRPVPAQGAAGGAPQGHGYFVTPERLADETAYDYLGADPTRVLSLAQRQAWASRLGLARAPGQSELRLVLYETLAVLADPAGEDTCPPLVHGHDGLLRLPLAGVVRRLTPDLPEWAPVRDRLRRDYRAVREAALAGTAAAQKHRRFLGALLRKSGLSFADYLQFVPADLPQDETPLEPETTISESFDKADSDVLGPDLTWTEVENDLDVVSNRAQTGSGANRNYLARADSDLSSDDHYCQAVAGVSTGSDPYPAVLCRKDGTATRTMYTAELYFVEDVLTLAKYVSSVGTTLGQPVVTLDVGTDYTVKVQADGSTIKGFVGGSELASVTDTAITAKLRCGIFAYVGVAEATWDSFEAADLAAAAASLLWRPGHLNHLLIR